MENNCQKKLSTAHVVTIVVATITAIGVIIGGIGAAIVNNSNYNNGYKDGEAAASAALEKKVESIYKEGYENGYNDGYIKGIDDASTSHTSLPESKTEKQTPSDTDSYSSSLTLASSEANDNKKVAWLTDMPVLSNKLSSSFTLDASKDKYGNSYSHKILNHSGYIIYGLQKKYDSLSFTLAASSYFTNSDAQVQIIIYGDDARIYESPLIDELFKPQEETISIAGVDDLKIEFVPFGNGSGNHVIIGDMRIYES